LLTKGTRKKITKYDWSNIVKRDKNPIQTWHRLRRQIDIAIEDLTLLAKKLPDDKQEEVFTKDKIEKLAYALFLNIGSQELEPHRTLLATVLLRAAVDQCTSQYRILQPYLDLSRPVTDNLHVALQNCLSITHQVYAESRKPLRSHKCPSCGKRIRI